MSGEADAWEHYAALEQERDELREEVKQLRAAIEAHRTHVRTTMVPDGYPCDRELWKNLPS